MALRSYMKGLLRQSPDIEIVSDNSFSRISMDHESSMELSNAFEGGISSPPDSFHQRHSFEDHCPRTPVMTPRGRLRNDSERASLLRSLLLQQSGRHGLLEEPELNTCRSPGALGTTEDRTGIFRRSPRHRRRLNVRHDYYCRPRTCIAFNQ